MTTTFLIFSSQSFLPRAKVCLASITKHHPEINIDFRLLPDTTHKDVYVDNLTQIKNKAVKELLEGDWDVVISMGADCILYNRLDNFLSIQGDMVLTPHIVYLPKSGGAGFYQTGHANGDLNLYREESLPILDWILQQEMKDARQHGYFFEQTWLSALPFIWPGQIGICHDPGINFAYYNFSERSLTKEGDKYYVNNKPLRMVQFSGYQKGSPQRASKHSGEILQGELLELFTSYDKEIE